MARLFVFAIGGTGSRVIKSLSMLLASGVQPKDSDTKYEIVPIIIDPHKSNEDLKRTDRILGYYEKIHDEVSDNCGSSPLPYTEHEEEIMYFSTPADLAVFAT